MAVSISVTAYYFDTIGNKFHKKALVSIPTPCQPVEAVSPDSTVYCYSKVLWEMPRGFINEVYTAETVAQIITKINA